MVAGNEIVLKVLGGDVTGVVHVEASAEIMHDVAGKAEACALGALHVLRETQPAAQNRQNEQRYESKNLAAAHARELGTRNNQPRQRDGNPDEQHFENSRRNHSISKTD